MSKEKDFRHTHLLLVRCSDPLYGIYNIDVNRYQKFYKEIFRRNMQKWNENENPKLNYGFLFKDNEEIARLA